MRNICFAVLALVLLPGHVIATEPTIMGEETFGNKPLNDQNFKAWPGIMPCVNDKARVYHQWVNGSEFCCYRGDLQALNKFLANFAKTKSVSLELVLRPGPGVAQTFKKEKTVSFDWKIHLNGGIAAHMATRDQGANIWPTHPVMTFHVDEKTDLPKLVIPENIKVLQLADLKKRFSKCLTSKDNNVRGWSCGQLVSLNKYDEQIMNDVAKLLSDDVDWVRLNALISIAQFGIKAKNVANLVTENLTHKSEQLRKQADKTLVSIKAAKTDEVAEKKFNQLLQKISRYCTDSQ